MSTSKKKFLLYKLRRHRKEKKIYKTNGDADDGEREDRLH